jgi:hypothetical protein
VAGHHPRDATLVDLDEGNEAELAAHGITVVEVFEVLMNEPTWAQNRKGRAGLYIAVGFTHGGRALTIPVAYDEGKTMVRPVTGWDSTSGEKAKYLKGRR